MPLQFSLSNYLLATVRSWICTLQIYLRSRLLQSQKQSMLISKKPSHNDSVVTDAGIYRLDKKISTSPGHASAGADGLLSGLPVLQAVQQIDPSVLAAIKESTAAHLEGLPTVHDYVAQHFFDVPVQTADGWFERLTGYVAEQKAAAALEAAGHHVTFAATSNQPVWDLLVDGQPVQIKEGISGVRAYLLEHQGVPVYTGEQVALSVKDPFVHGLKGLDSSDIHELTHQSLNGISDVFNPSFHFPLITLALSSYRETKLLILQKTTYQRASKNIGIDVVGVGVGAFAGAKAGAAIGAFATPVGAAAGALAGGVIGGISGKLASNKFRYDPFRAAVADFEDWSTRTEDAINKAVLGTREEVQELGNSLQTKDALKKDVLGHETKLKFDAVLSALEVKFIAFADTFVDFLMNLETDLEADEAIVMRGLPAWSWRAHFWPSEQDIFRSAIMGWFQQARAKVAVERSLILAAPRTLEGKRAAILRFSTTYNFNVSPLNGPRAILFQEYMCSQEEATYIRSGADADLRKHRDSLLHEFGGEMAAVYDRLAQIIQGWNERMQSKKDALRREASTVGIDL